MVINDVLSELGMTRRSTGKMNQFWFDSALYRMKITSYISKRIRKHYA